MPLVDKLLLRQRTLIETINDQIKNIQQVQHTAHHRAVNALVHVKSAPPAPNAITFN